MTHGGNQPPSIRDDHRSIEELEVELGVLRAKCAESQRRLAEKEEALVELSVKLNKEFVMLYSLLEFSKAISSSLDKGTLLDGALAMLERVFELPAVAVFEWRSGEEFSTLIGTSIPALRAAGPLRLSANEPFIRPVLQAAQVCLSDDLLSSDGEFCRRYLPEMRAALCAPMVCHGQLRGIVAAFAPSPDVFTEQQFLVMSAIAGHLAVGIENSDLHCRVQQQATTDELTGLLNRRAMDERLVEEKARATRHRRPLSLLMIDIDHFKRFNDTFGHHYGDVVLRRLGHLFRVLVRGGDICARCGGDEFVIILPDTAAEGAAVIAARIRKAVAHLSGQPEEGKGSGEQLQITASIGIASIAEGCDTDTEALLRRADEALYQAKAQGRNQVCVS